MGNKSRLGQTLLRAYMRWSLLVLVLVLAVSHWEMAVAQRTLPVHRVALPGPLIAVRNFLPDFALLPHAVPAIAANGGIYLIGPNDWLINAKTFPIRSVFYQQSDSILYVLACASRRAMLLKTSIKTGKTTALDTLNGEYLKFYRLSATACLLLKKQGAGTALMIVQYGKERTKLFETEHQVTAAAAMDNNQLAVAVAKAVLVFDNRLHITSTINVGVDIEDLLFDSHQGLFVSTLNGIVRYDPKGNGHVVDLRHHGRMQRYGNGLYVLDAGDGSLVKMDCFRAGE